MLGKDVWWKGACLSPKCIFDFRKNIQLYILCMDLTLGFLNCSKHYKLVNAPKSTSVTIKSKWTEFLIKLIGDFLSEIEPYILCLNYSELISKKNQNHKALFILFFVNFINLHTYKENEQFDILVANENCILHHV